MHISKDYVLVMNRVPLSHICESKAHVFLTLQIRTCASRIRERGSIFRKYICESELHDTGCDTVVLLLAFN